MTRTHRSSRRAIAMAETILSTLIVGMVLVATIQLVAPVIRSGTVMRDRLVAANLARELSEEIATRYFTSPYSDDLDHIGTDTEVSRRYFDDIDDYDGMSNSPPQLSDQTELGHLSGWTRSVRVEHVRIDNPKIVSDSYTGLKRVTVTVSRGGVTLATMVSLHAHEADRLGFVLQEDPE